MLKRLKEDGLVLSAAKLHRKSNFAATGIQKSKKLKTSLQKK